MLTRGVLLSAGTKRYRGLVAGRSAMAIGAGRRGAEGACALPIIGAALAGVGALLLGIGAWVWLRR